MRARTRLRARSRRFFIGSALFAAACAGPDRVLEEALRARSVSSIEVLEPRNATGEPLRLPGPGLFGVLVGRGGEGTDEPRALDAFRRAAEEAVRGKGYEGGEGARATLEIEVTRFDLSELTSRRTARLGARFTLRVPSREETLWEQRIADRVLSDLTVAGPRDLERPIERFVRDALRPLPGRGP